MSTITTTTTLTSTSRSTLTTLPLPLRPLNTPPTEPKSIQRTITALSLQSHIEGGYFRETDRDPRRVPNPFPRFPTRTHTAQYTAAPASADDSTRSASTSIYYYLTPTRSFGAFHRIKQRTIHTLHRGRGRYVLIHADEERRPGEAARVETFVVGRDVERGERCQWIVEGGKYKASILLEDEDGDGESKEGLLISETCVPGFEYWDHDFLTKEGLGELLGEESAKELGWLISGAGKKEKEEVKKELNGHARAA